MILRWSLALIICSVLVWAISLDFSPTPEYTPEPDQHSIDYFIEDLELRSLNRDGSLSYELKTETLLHYKNADTIEFTSPNILVADNQAIRWQLESSKGIGDIKGDKIELIDNVKVADLVNKLTPTELSTETAQIDRITQTIESTDHVDIVMGANTLTAQGLHISLETGQVELKSSVTGTFNTEN